MRIRTLAAGACAVVLFPAAALAQQACEQHQNHRMVGTLAGAGVGAIAGGAIGGHGNRTEGAMLGGVVGALVGNQASKGQANQANCGRAYGFYDSQGDWRPNKIARDDARGYFDREGGWVEGAPRGYYGRDGRWVASASDVPASGYYAEGLWVPAAAGGYYGQDGRWTPSAAGYYGQSGQWNAGPATGRYDANGRWMPGQASGRRDANGAWIADPQPGYYDKGRWIRGETVGYYDTRGQWIATEGRTQRVNATRDAPGRGSTPPSIDERQAQLADRIDRGLRNGRLSRAEAGQARRTLVAIERQERSLRTRQGYLGPRGQAIIAARLDGLSESLRVDVRETY